MLELNLLGTPEVRIDGIPPDDSLFAKDLALLYYLAATGQPQPRTSLAVLLWGDLSDAASRGNLRKALSTLRQTFEPWISTEREYVSLAMDQVYCDVHTFEQQAQAGLSAGNVAQLQAAITLYRGDFLSGFVVRNAPDYDLWLYHTQERLRGIAVRILDELAQVHRRQDDTTTAAACLQQILTLEPWREEVHRQLMAVLASAGQRSAALHQYEACVDSLATELGVEPGSETRDLYQRIRDGRFAVVHPAPPATVSAPAPRPRLPAELTPIVGRDRELAELEALLAIPGCRLVSIVGPGGIGKTRLALALAHRLQTQFDAVALESVANLERPADVLPVAVQAFGLALPPAASPAAMLQQLNGRALLVLDNFEHLLPGGVAAVETLLTAVPGLVCVVTTREALAVAWEWRYEVQELAYPPGADDARLGEYGAVQLFLQLARRTRPRYALQRSELPHVVRICQLVGGMPLGIEFAAAQLGRLPCDLIADELTAGLDRLDAKQHETLRNLPARQRSLVASFEASWRTLAAEEQRVLAILSILRGEFTVDAALSIAETTVVSIMRLVDKSLIRLTGVDRYALHEVIRRLAEHKLAATPGAPDAAFARYKEYYITLAQGALRTLFARLVTTPDLRGYYHSLRSHLHYIWQQVANEPDAAITALALSSTDMALRTFEIGAAGDSLALLGQVVKMARPQQQELAPLEVLSLQDVVPLDVIWLPEMADDVVDLTEFLAAERDQLLPALVENCHVEGRLLAIPFMVDIGLLYYRRDLLEKYGFGGPPRTWLELEAMAAEIQAQERAAGRKDFWGYIWQGYYAEHLVCNALEWQHGEGGGLILAADGTVTINNAPAIAALERARKWIGAISPPTIRVSDESSCAQDWRQGKAAFMRLWSTGYPIFDAPIIGEVTGITILPRGAVRHAATLGGWPLTVRAGANNVETAVRLIRDISSASAQRARALSHNPIPPTLRALYDDPEIAARAPVHREILTLIEAGGLAIRPAKIAGPRYAQVSGAYSATVAKVLYDGSDAAEALAALEQTLVALT